MNQSCSAISLFLPTWLAASKLYYHEPLLTVLLWEASAIQGIRSGVRGKGGGAGMRDRERDREENTKLADTGHNLISTVGGQLCSVICHGSPFRLQWPAWPAKENSGLQRAPFQGRRWCPGQHLWTCLKETYSGRLLLKKPQSSDTQNQMDSWLPCCPRMPHEFLKSRICGCIHVNKHVQLLNDLYIKYNVY